MSAEFEFATSFANRKKLVVSFEVRGERFDLVVPRDGRCISLVLATELEEMMDLFFAVMPRDSFDRFEDLVYGDLDEEVRPLTISQVTTLYHHAITLLSGGKPYWVVQRMVMTARAIMDQFLGENVEKKPFSLPLHEFVALVYAWISEGADRDGRAKLDKEIQTPPPGVERELLAATPEWANAGNDFMAAMAARGAR